MKLLKTQKICLALIVAFLSLVSLCKGTAYAETTLTISPMEQKMTLYPGESSTGSIRVSNPANAKEKIGYRVFISPFSRGKNSEDVILEENGDYTNIVNWVKLSRETGEVEPNGSDEITFTVDVPKNATGGGQYFAVVVASVPATNPDAPENSATISEVIQIASVVYAEVSGDINLAGSIRENNISSIFLNPPISASFIAENKGNTHAEITFFMQVFPLFSNEEIYTNEENPEVKLVLPGTTRFLSQSWKESPTIGIFRVVQTVYYGSTDGTPSVSEKTVIIAPLWFIFLVLLIVFSAIFWLISRIVRRKKSAE